MDGRADGRRGGRPDDRTDERKDNKWHPQSVSGSSAPKSVARDPLARYPSAHNPWTRNPWATNHIPNQKHKNHMYTMFPSSDSKFDNSTTDRTLSPSCEQPQDRRWAQRYREAVAGNRETMLFITEQNTNRNTSIRCYNSAHVQITRSQNVSYGVSACCARCCWWNSRLCCTLGSFCRLAFALTLEDLPPRPFVLGHRQGCLLSHEAHPVVP